MLRHWIAASSTLFLAAVLIGCSSPPPREEQAAQDYVFVGDEPVFAIIHQRNDGQWNFDNVTLDNREAESGFLVRLNDLAPAFDTRPAECEPRPYREQDRCNPLNPFRDKDVGVVGKIVDTGISAGTGGAIKSVSRSYRTSFDQLEFNSAVDQALLNSGLDESRIKLIDGLHRLQATRQRQTAELATASQQMLDDYQRDLRDNVRIDLSIDGLDNYYSHDLNPAELVDVSAKSPAASTAGTSSDSIDNVLPCKAENCYGLLHSALRKTQLQHDSRLAALRASLDAQLADYRVDCSKSEFNGYHFALHCPEFLQRNPGAVMELPVRVVIHSRDFPHLYPEFSQTDEHLSAAFEQGQLVLENLTDDFIDVQSVSLYYNSLISTVADSGGQLDLAPRQRRAEPAREFASPAINIEAKHANMTPDKARRTSFSFGVAVKYSLRDRDAIETIYAVHDFAVSCAIENRLRPGSCDEPADTAIAATDELDSLL